MASKRATVVLRPAFNGLRSASAAAQLATKPYVSARNASIAAPQPRKLTRSATPTVQVRYSSSEASGEKLGKTRLYELHAKNGAKFVPFGGYSMPVQYGDLSIVDSHKWTREKASLFDVGHM